MIIITNRVPRDLVSWHEMPEKARKDFDYLAEEDHHSPRFVQYKGEWYDVFDTQAIRRWGRAELTGDVRVQDDDPLAKWDAMHSDSFFSGIVFKLVDDNERVILGRYIA